MVKTFIWKAKDKEISVSTLSELNAVLIACPQEEIQEALQVNLSGLITWLEQNFPKLLTFVTRIKASLNEFTPQQMRELLIRTLRQIT